MTLDEYTGRLTELMSTEIDNARAVEYIKDSNLLLATIKNRIQKEGRDSSGRQMADYSTQGAYFPKSQFVKKGAFKGQGKNGKKRGKPSPKSMYLKNGYKEFRDIQGRQTEHRDLTLSGDMMNDYVLGVDDTSVLLGFTSEKQSVKRKGNEKRNGSSIFTATNQELSDFNTNIEVSENKIITNLFKK